jgi:hypothetical protein
MALFPTSPTASSIKITSISPTLTSVTHSLKRQARQRGGQRWALELDYPPMTRAEFAPLFAFSVAQKGQYQTFTYQPPIYSDTSGTATGTLLVNNASGYSVGDSTVATDGLTGTLKAGDFIKFAGHDKVYMLTADGSTTLTIEPPLNDTVADDEAITYNDVPFAVAFVNDSQSFGRGAADLHDFSISLVEIV